MIVLTDKEKFRFRLVKSKFRVKIKSFAEEARIIKSEIKKTSKIVKAIELGVWGTFYESVAGDLRHHYVEVVRKEQRHTLLAYAFFRGRPYKQIENKTDNPPDANKIKRILKSLSGNSDLTEIINWLQS